MGLSITFLEKKFQPFLFCGTSNTSYSEIFAGSYFSTQQKTIKSESDDEPDTVEENGEKSDEEKEIIPRDEDDVVLKKKRKKKKQILESDDSDDDSDSGFWLKIHTYLIKSTFFCEKAPEKKEKEFTDSDMPEYDPLLMP